MYDTYTDWIEGVRDWLDADSLSDDQVSVFLVLAQQRMNRELAVFEMEASVELVNPGTTSVNVPVDFNRIRQVSVNGMGTYTTKDKGEFVNRIAKENDTEKIYCIDTGTLRIYPYIADLTKTITFDYYVKVPLLSDIVDNNVFSTHYSDMLLFAAIAEGSNFIVEGDRMQLFEAKYLSQLEKANGARTAVKYGSTPLKRNIGA